MICGKSVRHNINLQYHEYEYHRHILVPILIYYECYEPCHSLIPIPFKGCYVSILLERDSQL